MPLSVFEKMFKPSTRAFWKEARSRQDVSLWEAVHGLFYLKWPEFYISTGLRRGWVGRVIATPAFWLGKAFGLWDTKLGSSFADSYHGKALPLPEVTRLIGIGKSIRVELPEQVLPYKMARSIILDNPNDLVLLRCPCRATVKSPCLPLEVCIIVGKPVTDFVLEHHPDKTRRITVSEAIDVVRQAQMRGNVSHAFFKEAVLGRYYAICNCCSCCCGAMQAHRQGTPMLASSGYVAQVIDEKCISCGKCARICPFSAITMKKDPTTDDKPLPSVDSEVCLGCGVCTLHCPNQALELRRDEAKPAPLPLHDFARSM